MTQKTVAFAGDATVKPVVIPGSNRGFTFAPRIAPNVADAERLFAHVLPDLPTGDLGWLSLHYTRTGLDGEAIKSKYVGGGKEPEFRSSHAKGARGLASALAALLSKPDTRDVWFCASATSELREIAGKSGRGPFKVAHRHAANFLSSRALRMDLDVKAGAYASRDEAVGALLQATQARGFPNPTALVSSGTGGVHAYWALEEAMAIGEWSALAQGLSAWATAQGLKFDAGCTTDPVRILRVPGSKNFKPGGPYPVELFAAPYDGSQGRYPVATMREALGAFVGPTPASAPSVNRVGPDFGPIPKECEHLLAGVTDELSTGIETGAGLRDIEAVAAVCPLVAEALATGGAAHDQALWNLTVLASVFCDNGRQTAHRLSFGHEEYAAAQTDGMYDRKVAEQQRNNLGFPSCAAFERAGATQCATCPQRSKGSSPLSLVTPALGVSALLSDPRGLPDLAGGMYDPVILMAEMNARFALVDFHGAPTIIHRRADGKDVRVKREDFATLVANVFALIERDNRSEPIPAAKFWLSNASRSPIRLPVFKPVGAATNHEYNFWRGFAYERDAGRDKVRRFLRHVWQVVCSRNRQHFKYLVRWMAWSVQNPEKMAEVAVVLRSEAEGSGKGTVVEALYRLFGAHHAVRANWAGDLLGQFNPHLEWACFAACNEALFAGDPRNADKIKDVLNGPKLTIEHKFGGRYTVDNKLKVMMTSNHGWTVPAGEKARRFFVLDVSEAKVGDRAWFAAINADLEIGGLAQLLDMLLAVNLGDWHPRQLVRTVALARQQVMSAGTVLQWLLDCANAGVIEGENVTFALREEHTTKFSLYPAYVHWVEQFRGKIEKPEIFGRELGRILGRNFKRHNVPRAAASGATYHPGYLIPDPLTIHECIRVVLGAAPDERISGEFDD